MTLRPIPILLYHAVSDPPTPGRAEFTVAPALFHEHVRAILDGDRQAVTVAELAASRRGLRPLLQRPILITFDDGFRDTVDAVEHVLGMGLKATVFIATGRIDVGPAMSAAAVRRLAGLAPDVEVGAHTVTHPRLDELPAAAVERELIDSRATLEDLTQAEVPSFAYPHGSYDRVARAAVIRTGFVAAAAVKNALSHDQDDLFALARYTVTSTTSPARIEALLAGKGAPLARRDELLRTRLHRSVRRLRRRIGRDAP